MNQSPETTPPSERPPRLTLGRFAHYVQSELLDLDRGLLGTWLQLWRRPGATIRRYIEWRDPRLTPPVRYAIVCLALSTLLLHGFGVTPEIRTGLQQGFMEADEGQGPRPAWISLMLDHLHWWLYLVAIPAMAAALESGYRGRVNLAEALAFATYSLAQISLGLALLMILSGEALGYTGALPLLLWPLYFATACYGYSSPDQVGIRRAMSSTVVMLALLVLFTFALVFVALLTGRWLG